MIEVFKTGYYDYSKEGHDKPVKYSKEMLKDIASSVSNIPLTNTHTGEVIGSLNNFTYRDGGLYAEEPQGLNLDGLGISPTFELECVEEGDYNIPVNWELMSVAVVTNPRKPMILNNSNGDVNMADDKLLDSLNRANEELANQKAENIKLQEEIKKFEEREKDFEARMKEVEKQNKKFEKLQQDFEAIKPQAEKYEAYREHRKAELIKKFNPTDDEKIQKYFEKKSLEDLEFELENNLYNTKPQGAGLGSPGEQNGELPEGNNPNEPVEGSAEDFYKKFEEFEAQNTTW